MSLCVLTLSFTLSLSLNLALPPSAPFSLIFTLSPRSPASTSLFSPPLPLPPSLWPSLLLPPLSTSLLFLPPFLFPSLPPFLFPSLYFCSSPFSSSSFAPPSIFYSLFLLLPTSRFPSRSLLHPHSYFLLPLFTDELWLLTLFTDYFAQIFSTTWIIWFLFDCS